MLFEAFAIQVLQETSIQAARKIFGISWDEAWHLMHRALSRGLARKKPRLTVRLGVDEKAAGRGQTHYVTVVCDLTEGTVEEVTEGREKQSLLAYLEGLTPEQRQAIQAVAMDMCDAYIDAVLDGLAEGKSKIVFDRFHIMKHKGHAVGTVRRTENQALLAQGDESLVGGTRHMWRYAPRNLPERYWADDYALRRSDLKTARAWAIKENLRRLWSYKTLRGAQAFWKRWYFSPTR